MKFLKRSKAARRGQHHHVPRPAARRGGLHRPGQVLGLDDLRAAAAALRLLHCLPDGPGRVPGEDQGLDPLPDLQGQGVEGDALVIAPGE